MNIEEQFNLIAKEYDANRRKFISCFDDYYDGTTKFVAANITMPKRILDLGAGTGLLTSFWYRQFPETEYILTDIAEEMLKVAKERFTGLDNISYRAMDYTKELPKEDFDTIISALSIHHLENEQKQALFTRIYEKLPAKGMFVNYDQFCAETPFMSDWINAYWEKQILLSGLSDKDIELWKERRKLDREVSVEKEIAMLKKSGFQVTECVYSYQKFSVIVAIKG
ncbi:MAG: class I SAM-dependent methyltransferase [Lachnospiraceae bacterium]|nr:class I SAM-dependent methyltransferase [Lachnospiraceae bacterium]